MSIAAAAASHRRVEVYRVTDAGSLEHRWLDCSLVDSEWTGWRSAPFVHRALAVAAISGWDEQIEVFVLDRSGQVWNRWWWYERGWTPNDQFNLLGSPFGPTGSRALSALSAGNGHFNVFVEGPSGQIAVLPHVAAPNGPFWRRCDGPEALGDGWWPAFDLLPDDVYRRPVRA